jgi:hypothetical protein
MRISAGVGQQRQHAGGRVPVHPHAGIIAQDRPVVSAVDGPIDRPSHRWRQRDQHRLVALAADLQHAVAVFLAEVADAGAGPW